MRNTFYLLLIISSFSCRQDNFHLKRSVGICICPVGGQNVPVILSDDQIRYFVTISERDFNAMVLNWINGKHEADEEIEVLIGDKKTTFKELHAILFDKRI